MPSLNSKALNNAENLMYSANFYKALETLADLEKDGKLTPEEQLSVLILKGRIFNYQEQDEKATKIGELAYKLSQKLGRVHKMVDALLIQSPPNLTNKVEDHIVSESEKLLNSIQEKSSPDYIRLKSEFLLVKSNLNLYSGKFEETLELVQQSLQLQEKINKKIIKSRIFIILSLIYTFKSEFNFALEYALRSLEIQTEMDNFVGVATSLTLVGNSYFSYGDFDQALEYCKRSLKIKQISIRSKCEALHTLAATYKQKGELDRALRYFNRASDLMKKEVKNDQYLQNIIGIGNTYRMKGNLDTAIEYLKKSLKFAYEANSLHGMSASLFYLILSHLNKKSLEGAQNYLKELEQFAEQTKDEVFSQVHIIAKALVLKQSGRIRHRTEAEILLKQVAEKESVMPPLFLIAMVNLCDLFLEELEITNNSEVLLELNPIISKLSHIAKKQNAYLWLTELNVLKAKLALIQMNIDQAKELFTQAQHIAEMHGLNLLAIKISNEHDKLLEQSEIWDELKESNAPMSERIKLASVDGVIDRMQGKKGLESLEIFPENPVLLLIIGEGGFPLLSNPFTEDWAFEGDLLSGFLDAFTSFSGEIFSKGLDRAKFGDYTILMEAIHPFSICYLFKGQTFRAKQKLTQFVDRVQNSESIWKILNKYYNSSLNISLKSTPSLESLISEIFLGKIL